MFLASNFCENLGKKDSLWVDFLNAKYIGQVHPWQVFISRNSSHVWRRMLKFRELAESCITWDINAGNSYSLWDIGLEKRLLEKPMGYLIVMLAILYQMDIGNEIR